MHRIVIRSPVHGNVDDLFANRDEHERSMTNSLEWAEKFVRERLGSAPAKTLPTHTATEVRLTFPLLSPDLHTLLNEWWSPQLLRVCADLSEFFLMGEKFDKAKPLLEHCVELFAALQSNAPAEYVRSSPRILTSISTVSL